jgi:phage FluMu protein Com
MSTLTQIQVRCTGCNRRLGDYLSELEAGQVILELKCPRCGQPHTEIIRPANGSRTRAANAMGVAS